MTYAELFFDLIFVFAITQISHGLLHHPNLLGAIETLILFGAVWWVWIYTAWATNWLDPEQGAVRAMLFAMMAAGLAMAVSLPKAWESAGLVFAMAHVAMQLGRTAFVWWALGPGDAAQRRNFLRIGLWLAAAAPFWILGGLLEGWPRIPLWLCALAIEWISPALFFRVPGLGASEPAAWRIQGHHMAERCGLFVIIALGETLLVTGATFADRAWTSDGVLALVAAFLGTLAMWWIYFDRGAASGARFAAETERQERMSRLGYTYLHAAIVAGIVLAAAGDERLLAHPDHGADLFSGLLLLGGPALFLLGVGAFKRIWMGWFPLSHRIGLGLLLALLPLAFFTSQATLALLTSLALAVTAAWERLSLGQPARHEA